VNAIWVAGVYEQTHGWVPDDGGTMHSSYHGYYALDFSTTDLNYGTEDDFKEMVDAAHAKGIRIVMDIVMNHAGYNTYPDMAKYGFGKICSVDWDDYYYSVQKHQAFWGSGKCGNGDGYGNYIAYNENEGANINDWSTWWGFDWIRADIAGYYQNGGANESSGKTCIGSAGIESCVDFLPDFKTESTQAVSIPQFMQTKWTMEGRKDTEQAELDSFFQERNWTATPRNHLIKWLTDYVREFGVDGFRVDTVKHVNLSDWQALIDEASAAYEEWKDANPTKVPGPEDLPFWTTAEHWNHGAEKSDYFNYGFDSMINFSFQGNEANLAGLEDIYADYAGRINTDPGFNLLSYMSSHDKGISGNRGNKDAATGLMMLPGGVQIFYGDEVGRELLDVPNDAKSTHHWFRSSMPFGKDDVLLAHWQKLGKFRNRHVAVGGGAHEKLNDTPYTFSRIKGDDKVIVVFSVSGETTIDVSAIGLSAGDTVRDAYSGSTATVEGTSVTFNAEGVLLLEKAQ